MYVFRMNSNISLWLVFNFRLANIVKMFSAILVPPSPVFVQEWVRKFEVDTESLQLGPPPIVYL